MPALLSAGLLLLVLPVARAQPPALPLDKGDRPGLVPQTGHGRRGLSCVALSPDGRFLATGSYLQVKLWDVASGLELRTFTGLGWATTALAFDGKQRLLAAGSRGEVLVWKVDTGERARRFQAVGEVFAVAFSPDGQLLAVGSEAGPTEGDGLKIWSLSTGKEAVSLVVRGPFQAVAFRGDGKRLATWTRRAGLQVWDTSRAKPVWTRAIDGVGAVAFTPDGKALSGVITERKKQGAVSFVADTANQRPTGCRIQHGLPSA
jgi:WD40 repeat protein